MRSDYGVSMGIKVPFDRAVGLGRKFVIEGNKNQGALSCGKPNFSESSGVSPLVRSVRRTSFGSQPLSLAVWIIVAMRDTFFVPRRERLAKIIFLRMTKFLKRSLLGLSKVFFKRLVFSFKLMDLPFKINHFLFRKTKDILPPNPLPEIISFSKDFSRRFSAKIRTGFRKGAILNPCGVGPGRIITHLLSSLNCPFRINSALMSVSSSMRPL